MLKLTRRQLLSGFGAAAAAPQGLALPALAKSRAKIVIIGGGAGGASAASALKRADARLDVVLVEPAIRYTSCFFSNHYIGGFRTFQSITHGYGGLAALDVNIVHATARCVDPSKKTVRFGDGSNLRYDRLIVAPGIDFKWGEFEGYSEAAAQVMPHAWRGGAQSRLLRLKLEDMRDGGTVVIAPPRMPYRCPPGPYERACVIANYLKTKKPKSKLVILDPKMTFSKQPVFLEGFAKYYKDIIELHLSNDIDDFSLARVKPGTGEIVTESGLTVKADVANIIPGQTAGRIAVETGLTDDGWCTVRPENFTSTKMPDVYVLGDAANAAEMPKSAFSAHSQALAVAADIITDLSGGTRGPGRYRNTCWSMIAPGDSAKIGADYAVGDLPGGKRGLAPSGAFVSKPGESPAVRKATYEEALAWYPTLISQAFNTKVRP